MQFPVFDKTRRRFVVGASNRIALASLTALVLADRVARKAIAATPTAAPINVLVLGDSLSAEYGLPRGSGWVSLLERRISERYGNRFALVNASVSGETTAGGHSRLARLLAKHRPGIVVIELGANDALRGLDLASTERNLASMVDDTRASGASVVVVGMQVPPNYGREYTTRFASLFGKVASGDSVALVPFLLEGIADDLSMFQPDRIHPTAAAQPRLLENVWSRLAPILDEHRAR